MLLPPLGAETNRLVPQGAEFLVLVANRVHFSQCYVYFYLFMFILNTFAIVWVRERACASVRARVSACVRACSPAFSD